MACKSVLIGMPPYQHRHWLHKVVPELNAAMRTMVGEEMRLPPQDPILRLCTSALPAVAFPRPRGRCSSSL